MLSLVIDFATLEISPQLRRLQREWQRGYARRISLLEGRAVCTRLMGTFLAVNDRLLALILVPPLTDFSNDPDMIEVVVPESFV